MARAVIAAQDKPSAPPTDYGTSWFDSDAEQFFDMDDAGRAYGMSLNASIASQGAGFSSDTYVTDSNVLIPSFGLQVRTVFTWMISASKTGAGTATPIYYLRIGANASTGDTARLTLTGPAQTAVADIGTLYVMATVRSIGASGVIQGSAWWTHRGTAASTTVSGVGFANDVSGHVEGTSAGFDNSVSAMAGKHIGLSIDGGGSAAWTITQVRAEAVW